MYTLKIRRSFLFYRYYEVNFEDTPIRILTGVSYENAKDFVRLLNTAYELGYSSGHICGSLDINKKVHEDEKVNIIKQEHLKKLGEAYRKAKKDGKLRPKEPLKNNKSHKV